MRSRFSDLTLGLAALLAVQVSLLAMVCLIEGWPWYNVFGVAFHLVVKMRQGLDSWRPMQAALEYARASPGAPIYTEIFFHRRMKLQYPPSSLLLVWNASQATLKGVSLAALLANAALVCATLETAIVRFGHSGARAGHLDRAVRVGIVFALSLLAEPLAVAFMLGQIQAWLNGLFALAVWMWIRNRAAGAGGVIGFMSWIKPQHALFVLWAWLRREYRMATAVAAVGVAGAVAGIAAFGLVNSVDYVRVLRVLSERGEAFAPNQSFNGLLQRLFENANSLRFTASEFPPFHPVIYAATLALFLASLAIALGVPRRDQRGSPADLAFFTIAMTVSAPIAWDHHYGIFVPVIAAALVPFVQTMTRRDIIWLGVGWLLISTQIEPLFRVAESPWNLVQSYRFFGALLIAGLFLKQMNMRASANTAGDRPIA
jgi:alpha-1,2-mannosyltransferase